MDERPAPPPEGKLIADALARKGLSIREASRRANISYGRWRQITSGYQNVSPGVYAPVHAPAATLARMARVVGVTPGQLEQAGRADVAEVLSADTSQPAADPLATLTDDDIDAIAAVFIQALRNQRASEERHSA